MKISSLVLITFIITFVLAGGSPRAYAVQDPNTKKTIDIFIAKQAQRLRGEEYGEARKVASGDLTSDRVAETVVLYTIEGQGGSNNYVQYLAVFAPGKVGLVALTHTVVGGKSGRSVELTSVDNQAIQLATLSYGPKDASCCPRIKGNTEFVLRGKMLREQKHRTKPRQ